MKIMVKHIYLIGVTIAFFGIWSSISADSSNVFTPTETHQIEKIVQRYLIQHPEIMAKVSIALQKKQLKTAEQKIKRQVTQQATLILSSANSPIAGNPKGKITLVDFFDNQCIHCKRMTPILKSLIKKNPELRIVFKEFPIFGKMSLFAAKAALAANRYGRYLPFHNALLASENRLTTENILNIGRRVGLSKHLLKKGMAHPSINAEITMNYQLAKQLELHGTPVFILTKSHIKARSHPLIFVSLGQVSEATLQQWINRFHI
jgi:protein-disulfide isomerase